MTMTALHRGSLFETLDFSWRLRWIYLDGPEKTHAEQMGEDFDWSDVPTLFDDGSTAGDVYDAIGLLREGVVSGSRFKVNGFGRVRFNKVCDWLQACGYPVEGVRLPVKPKPVKPYVGPTAAERFLQEQLAALDAATEDGR